MRGGLCHEIYVNVRIIPKLCRAKEVKSFQQSPKFPNIREEQRWIICNSLDVFDLFRYREVPIPYEMQIESQKSCQLTSQLHFSYKKCPKRRVLC